MRIEHGTITAKINNYKFEITTLRKMFPRMVDLQKLSFLRLVEDASRRDFTFNAIYADLMVIYMIHLMVKKI